MTHSRRESFVSWVLIICYIAGMVALTLAAWIAHIVAGLIVLAFWMFLLALAAGKRHTALTQQKTGPDDNEKYRR